MSRVCLFFMMLSSSHYSFRFASAQTPAIPADWADAVAMGTMLWNPNCTVSNTHVSSVWGRHASVANGYIGTLVDSGKHSTFLPHEPPATTLFPS